nr:hypothetical protein BaRGS_024294 [Batillaria attramentaria]
MHVTEKYWTDEWNGVFNWTWNFRRDADIWEPTNYLRPTKSPPPKTFFLELAEKKSKPVAWFVSDCGAVSRRDDYVRELQRHIAVDVFGSCGNLSCPRLPQEICFNMLTEQYFFYLSFENALCRDYVTEKFFNKFTPGVHVLPIVLGGANYSQFFPKGSFIDVAWFAHPKDLAQYMKNLMTDKATYAELLWRKAHLQKSGRGSQAAVCELCKRLHDLDTYGKRYDNIKTWRFDGQCFPPEWF